MQDDLSVAPGALAGIRDRPLLLKHFVDGAEGEAFQKRAPANRPLWLRTIALSFPAGAKRRKSSSMSQQANWYQALLV
jgi:DNA primase